jgi:glycosyltransferase involved in cell wall biosynthesis
MSDCVFSVVIIVYNQKEFIGATIDSILSQKHDYSFEIVIGDDCSIDGTRSLLIEYKRKNPNIIQLLLNDENMGITGNYYNVLRHCHGKYIMQCAGDDYWLPGKVALQIPLMENDHDIGMCYSKVRNIYSNKRIIEKKTWGGPFTTFDELLTRNVVPAVTMAFRSEYLNRYIGEVKPEEQNWLIEDYPEVLWFSLNSKVVFINEITAAYRVVSNSAVHTSNALKIEKMNASTRDIKLFFIGFTDGNREIDKIEEDYNRSLFAFYFWNDRQLAIKCYSTIAKPARKDILKCFICRVPPLWNLMLLLSILINR